MKNCIITVPPYFSLDTIPFWNERCHEIQKHCFLPKTENKKKNFTLEHHNDLIQSIKPSSFYSSVFSFNHSSYPKDKCIVKVARKVRLYFQSALQRKKYTYMLQVYRRAYNLSVDLYNEKKNQLPDGSYIQDIRPIVREIVKKEIEEERKEGNQSCVYDSNVVNQACDEAKGKFFKICENNQKIKAAQSGESYQKLGFKSRKNKVRSFIHHKLGLKGVCSTSLGKVRLSEKLPPESLNKTVRVTCDHNRWFLSVLMKVEIKETKHESQMPSVKLVALDPGSRNFLTGFSQNEAFFMGKGFSVEKLLPLAKKMRILFAKRQKLFKLPENKLHEDQKPQWFKNEMRCIEKQLDRLEWQRQDLVTRLHHECADFLVKHYDVILLPTFTTSEMVKRSTYRALNRAAVHNMLSLKYHEFKEFLLWKALKHGKKVILVNESYTSKTISWTGEIQENLKGKKAICVNGVSVDRDINGARNIFIKHLMLSLESTFKDEYINEGTCSSFGTANT